MVIRCLKFSNLTIASSFILAFKYSCRSGHFFLYFLAATLFYSNTIAFVSMGSDDSF